MKRDKQAILWKISIGVGIACALFQILLILVKP